MENNELQRIWKSIDTAIKQKSIEELDLLLTSKAKQIINRIIVIMAISILVCVGLLTFLTISSLSRQNDSIYLIINISLAVITVISLISGIATWSKLNNSPFNLSLKDWLKERINLLNERLYGKFSRLYLYAIPVLYILLVFSIHVYFENKTFLQVINSQESVIGLIVAAPIGLFAAFFSARKIRKYEQTSLDFLKDMHHRLSKES